MVGLADLAPADPWATPAADASQRKARGGPAPLATEPSPITHLGTKNLG